MNKGMIGIQMCTMKKKISEIGVYEAFRACAEIGYRCVEVSQLPMTQENVAAMKQACQDFGMKIAACSAAVEPEQPGAEGEYLSTHFDKIVADCKTLDCNLLRIGILPLSCMGSYEKALEFAKKADGYAQKLKEHGIDLYYHNHHVEFVKYDGEYLLDIIKDHTKYLGFELDTHWIQRGGENPVTFIKKYAGRIRLLHLKDYRIVELDLAQKDSANWFTGNVQFAEVGEGNLPIKECIQAGLDGGSEYFLVEQDETYGRDAFESMKISHDHLVEMGYGDWF